MTKQELNYLQNKYKQIIDFGKTLPNYIQATYWETNRKELDDLELKIDELRKSISY